MPNREERFASHVLRGRPMVAIQVMLILLCMNRWTPQSLLGDEIQVEKIGDPFRETAIQTYGTIAFQHNGGAGDCAFSADGRFLATVGYDSYLRVWESHSGRETQRVKIDGSPPFRASVSHDGRRIAVGDFKGSVTVFDFSTLRVVRKLDAAMSRSISRLAFSGGDKELFIMQGGFATLKTIETGNVLQSQLFRGAASCYCGAKEILALATSPNNPFVEFWNMRTLESLDSLVLEDSDREVACLQLSADGKWLAVGRTVPVHAGQVPPPYIIELYDVEANSRMAVLHGNSRHVQYLCFSREKRLLAASSKDSLVLWSLQDHKMVHELANNFLVPRPVQFSPDDRLLAALLGGNAVQVWDVKSGTKVVDNQGGPIHCIALSNKGSYVAAASGDGCVRVWARQSGKQIRKFGGYAPSIAFSPVADDLLALNCGDEIKVVSAQSGRQVRSMPTPFGCLSFAFSPDGRRLAIAKPNNIELLDASTGKSLGLMPIQIVYPNKPRSPFPIVYSPDGTTIAALGYGEFPDFSGIEFWNADTLERIHKIEATGSSGSFSIDGRLFALNGKTISVWELASGEPVVKPYEIEGSRALLLGQSPLVATRIWGIGSATNPVSEYHLGHLRIWDRETGCVFSASRNYAVVAWPAPELLNVPNRQDDETGKDVDMEDLWSKLGSSAGIAYDALQTIVGRGDAAVPLLLEKVKSGRTFEPAFIERTVRGLAEASDEAAGNFVEELRNVGPKAAPVVRKTLEHEKRRAAKKQLMAGLHAATSPAVRDKDLLRSIRAVTALRWIGTSTARAALREIAELPLSTRISGYAQQ